MEDMFDYTIYNTLEEEDTALMDFIKKNKYPEYKEIVNNILKYKRVEWFAEYSEINHRWSKEIYENIFNEELVGKYAKIIYIKGGFTALQAIFYIITNLSPINYKRKDLVIRQNFKFMLDKAFEKYIEKWLS